MAVEGHTPQRSESFAQTVRELEPRTLATRAEFGAALTRLRERSGVSLRELAAAVGSSPSTLSGWCRAKNLPFPAQTPVFEQLLSELGVEDLEPWLDALARVRDGGSREGEPPYRGLESFGADDAARFVGREQLVAHTLERLQRNYDDPVRTGLVVLVGPSGSGKSSLLHAGVGPALQAAGWSLATCTPASGLADVAERTTAGHDGTGGEVLLVDQLEELFTVVDGEGRERFLGQLAALTAPGTGRAAVLAVRADFYGELLATDRLTDALEHGQIVVTALTAEQLRRVIVEPARQAGVRVDDELVELLVAEFSPGTHRASDSHAGALPLLSHALLETWTRSSGTRLTVADHQAAGGVHGAVERSAETVHEGLDERQRAVARQLFLRLVHVEGEHPATRRPVRYVDLDGLGRVDRAELDQVLDRFIDARLLTAGPANVEISHEALLTAWPRLAGWVEEARDALRLHRRIRESARLWDDAGRDDSALARGALLASLRSVAADDPVQAQLNQRERDYLAASEARAQAEAATARRRTSRLRRLVAVTTVAGLVAVAAAATAWMQRDVALTARDEALSRQVAITAERLADTDPSLAAQLAVAGYEVAATTESRSALLEAAALPGASRFVGGPGPTALAVAPDGSVGAVSDSAEGAVQLFVAGDDGGWQRAGRLDIADRHDPPPDDGLQIFALTVSDDGRLLAVGDTEASVTLWDVTDPENPRPLGEPLDGLDGPVQGLALDGDATLFAVGAGDGIVRYDLSDPAAPEPLPTVAYEPITWSVTALADGRIAVGTDDGDVQLVDPDEPAGPVGQLPVGEREVIAVAASDDGRWLAASDRAGDVTVFDLDGDQGQPAAVELDDAQFPTWVNAVAFTSDGAWLAAGSSDGDVRVWTTDTWTLAQELAHPAAVTDLHFDDGGQTLTTTATDGSTRRWDLTTGVFGSLTGSVWNVNFVDEGRLLAAFSGEQTGRWDLDGLTRPRPRPVIDPADEGPDFSGAGAMSPDGELLAHGSPTGEVSLYTAADTDQPVPAGPPLTGSDQLVEGVVFHPQATHLAAAGRDTQVRLWQLDDGQIGPAPDVVLDTPSEVVLNLTWSPDGQLLAAASADNHVYLFDTTDPAAPRELGRVGGMDAEAYAAAFTPDSRYLATAGSDGYVLLFDLDDPGDPQQIAGPVRGPAGRIFDLSITDDGDRLAAAAVDGSVWLWDIGQITDPSPLAVLGRETDAIYGVDFDPAGQVIVSADAAGRIELWDLDPIDARQRICGRAGDPITPEEWEQHLLDRPYQPPCSNR